jgi:YggT family protein
MWPASPLSSKAPPAEAAINRCSATKIPPRALGCLRPAADTVVFAAERDVDAAHAGPCPHRAGALHLGLIGDLKSGPMIELLSFISYVITLYVYIIIAGAIMSWLIAFNVINPYNQFVRSLWQGLNALTEPVLRPIRRSLPDLGGIDISPLVLILICFFIQSVVLTNLAKLFV